MGIVESRDLPIITYKEFIESERILLQLNGNVIDATDYVASHPGGISAIQNKNKHDISEDYNFHRNIGKQKIKDMIIGKLE